MKNEIFSQNGQNGKTSGKTVLVIDNEEDLLKIIKRCLEKTGFDVETAISSEEGLQRLRSQKYSYLLTDLNMPVINGQQLISTAKEETLLDNTIVIVTTGSLSEEDMEKQENFLFNNVDGFLQKPFSTDELCRLINSFESFS